MDVRVGLWRKLSAKELMLLKCGVGEDSWEPLGLQGDPPVHSEGDQPWVFFGKNDAKAETRVLWPPHAKSWLIGKDSDAGRDWGQEEKGTTEDEMAGWHHWLDGHEFEWTPGVGDGQGGLACCDSWGHKESDTTEQLNWTELMTSLPVKNLPAMRETWVLSLGWEDPLQNGKATHSNILAWRIPWGCKEVDTTELLSLSLWHLWLLVWQEILHFSSP